MATYASAERVKKIFLEADTDKNGVLSKEELTIIMKKLSKWDDETIDALMKQCDYNKDGMVQITEFVDFLFCGTQKERDGQIECVSLMAMHEAYYDDLKDVVHDFLQKHKINRIDFNWEDAWPNAVAYCQENHVDVLSIDSDAIRVAVGDNPELWYERDMWIEKRDIPEEKLFEVFPVVKDIFSKSLNPVLSLQIIWCPPGSPEGGVDRIRRNLNSWNDGLKKILRTKEEQLAANERFKARASQMEALIAASEEAERIQKEKDIAAFKPLFDQVVAKGGWDEAKANKVFDHMVRGNMYSETWYIHAWTEGHVEKDLEKIGVEPFEQDEMQVLTDFAFEHDELSKTVRNLPANRLGECYLDRFYLHGFCRACKYQYLCITTCFHNFSHILHQTSRMEWISMFLVLLDYLTLNFKTDIPQETWGICPPRQGGTWKISNRLSTNFAVWVVYIQDPCRPSQWRAFKLVFVWQ